MFKNLIYIDIDIYLNIYIYIYIYIYLDNFYDLGNLNPITFKT
jgi:hypothetical protein